MLLREATRAWLLSIILCVPIFSSQSDGSEWTPNSSSRICSSHFVNGQKSNISTHPSYNPTVFPDVYKVRPFIGSDNLERFKRQVALRALGWLDNISYQVCGLVRKITSGGSGCAATLFTGYTVEFCCSCFSEVRTYVRTKIFLGFEICYSCKFMIKRKGAKIS